MSRTADRIELSGIRVVARHGVLEEEQRRSQPFEIDLVVVADLEEAARHDDLARTADYGRIVSQVVELATSSSFSLLEALAGAICNCVLAADEVIEEVTVTVRKLRPPIAADLASVAVTITRSREGPGAPATAS